MLPLVLSLPALWAIPHFAKSSLSSSYRRVPSRILTCCAKSSEASDQISRVPQAVHIGKSLSIGVHDLEAAVRSLFRIALRAISFPNLHNPAPYPSCIE
jgi:hypothetical protein